MELPDWEAASKEAIKVLPDIARDELPSDGNRRDADAELRHLTAATAHGALADGRGEQATEQAAIRLSAIAGKGTY